MIGIAAGSVLGVFDKNCLILIELYLFANEIRFTFIGYHLRNTGFFGSEIVNHSIALKHLVAVFEIGLTHLVAHTVKSRQSSHLIGYPILINKMGF